VTARERYESVKWEMQHQLPPFSGPDMTKVLDAADAALAEAEAELATAQRFINRFIIHDGEARPYSVREGQLMLERAEELNRRAETLLRDATLRYNGPQDDGLHRTVSEWLSDLRARAEGTDDE